MIGAHTSPHSASNAVVRNRDHVAWGEQFVKLAETRGVRVGEGGGPRRKDDNSVTVTELAAELGASERTAQRRVEATKLPQATLTITHPENGGRERA